MLPEYEQERGLAPQDTEYFSSEENQHYEQHTPSQKQKGVGSFLKELVKFVIIAAIIVVPIRAFVAQPFIVDGSSMYPTFKNGQYLIVDEISYDFHKPGRGDVIVFHYPKNTKLYFIKRIIGLPGETVKIRQGHVYIYNKTHPDGFELTEEYVKNPSHSDFQMTLTNNEYFMMGDNRVASADSRVWGPLPAKLIVGKVLLRLFPVDTAAIAPGQTESPLYPNKNTRS